MAEIKKPIAYSPSWTFFEGKWHDGNVTPAKRIAVKPLPA